MASEVRSRPEWIVGTRNRAAEQSLEKELSISPLLAAALVQRGFVSAADAERFLNPSLSDLHSPLLLPDCEKAVSTILAAKERGDKVFVHGDYDVDGVSSTAIWTRSLRRLGFDVTPHVPHRIREGYGIHEDAVRAAAESGAKLFITCDCGSSAIETVALARELGMTVVVTDHHELGDVLPDAAAVVNPHRKDSNYPFPQLAGAGVAYKVAQAVANECGASDEQFARAFLDLVCLGTISDVVPLIGENRILASLGLNALSTTKKPGLAALKRVSDLKPGLPVTSRDVGWRLGPRINAAGRIDDAAHALELLMTDDAKEASRLADVLNRHNIERQREQKRTQEQAEEMVLESKLNERGLIFVWAAGWHPGIVGIVAGKLANRFYRPTLVASLDEETGKAKGSARSIPGFSLHSALEKNKELFDSCGGHEMAAGFSASIEKLEEISERLISYAESVLGPEGLVPKIVADFEVNESELTPEAIESLTRLEPFGEGNRQPEMVMREVSFETASPLPSNPDHVRFTLAKPNSIGGMAWGLADKFSAIDPKEKSDILFRSDIDVWNGKRTAKIYISDVEKS